MVAGHAKRTTPGVLEFNSGKHGETSLEGLPLCLCSFREHAAGGLAIGVIVETVPHQETLIRRAT
ncbi:hypothetical protein D3C76_1876230 [compost metagenome]